MKIHMRIRKNVLFLISVLLVLTVFFQSTIGATYSLLSKLISCSAPCCEKTHNNEHMQLSQNCSDISCCHSTYGNNSTRNNSAENFTGSIASRYRIFTGKISLCHENRECTCKILPSLHVFFHRIGRTNFSPIFKITVGSLTCSDLYFSYSHIKTHTFYASPKVPNVPLHISSTVLLV